MKRDKDVLKKSDELLNAILEAEQIDNSQKIAELEDSIYKTRLEQQKWHWKEEDQLAFALGAQAEAFLNEKRNLNSDKKKKIEKAWANYDGFHKPYKQQFEREGTLIYEKLYSLNQYRVVGRGHDSIFLMETTRVETCALEVLRALKTVSEALLWAKTNRVSISAMIQKMDELEKLLSEKYEYRTIDLFSAKGGDLGLFKMVFGEEEKKRNPDWKPIPLSPSTIKSQMDTIFALMEPKEIHIA